MRKLIPVISGPGLGIIIYFLASYNGLDEALCRMAFVTVWMAVWWITEAVEIGVTSLLPFILMPALSILKSEEVASLYMEQTIFLFIGGFFLAYAMEKWDLHHRIAYRLILFTGTSPTRVMAGIMLTAYIISMWISNTATTLMLIAAVVAIVKHDELFDERIRERIGPAFLIALAYSATIGGMATIVGTPTNMIFTAYWETNYPLREAVTFFQWCKFGIPFSLVLLISGFVILKYMFGINGNPTDPEFIRNKYKLLGKVTREEKIVMTVFTITVILWFTRAAIPIGDSYVFGWEKLFPKGFIKDSTVAICMSVLLFAIPSGKKDGSLLSWNDVRKLPFHIILLFGGGFALAKGIEVSGLGDYLAGQLKFFKNYPLWILIVVLILLITFLSEIASNVATITLMLPILASLASATGIDPLKLMLPATFAASFGFMLVIATAPNTIAYAAGYFKSRDLLKAGLLLNLIAITLLTVAMGVVGFRVSIINI